MQTLFQEKANKIKIYRAQPAKAILKTGKLLLRCSQQAHREPAQHDDCQAQNAPQQK